MINTVVILLAIINLGGDRVPVEYEMASVAACNAAKAAIEAKFAESEAICLDKALRGSVAGYPVYGFGSAR